jgi:hypothetical protein
MTPTIKGNPAAEETSVEAGTSAVAKTMVAIRRHVNTFEVRNSKESRDATKNWDTNISRTMVDSSSTNGLIPYGY